MKAKSPCQSTITFFLFLFPGTKETKWILSHAAWISFSSSFRQLGFDSGQLSVTSNIFSALFDEVWYCFRVASLVNPLSIEVFWIFFLQWTIRIYFLIEQNLNSYVSCSRKGCDCLKIVKKIHFIVGLEERRESVYRGMWSKVNSLFCSWLLLQSKLKTA